MRKSRTRVGQLANPLLFYTLRAGGAKYAEGFRQISAAQRRVRAWVLVAGTLKSGFPEALKKAAPIAEAALRTEDSVKDQ